MHVYSFKDNSGDEWRRVNAIQARNAFVNGAPVTLCPVKLRPLGMWAPQFTVTRDDSAHAWELAHYGAANVWQMIVNSATAYNCSHETGYYLAFYVKTS